MGKKAWQQAFSSETWIFHIKIEIRLERLKPAYDYHILLL